MTLRGGRDAVTGVRNGVLRVRVASAPPAGGAANRACIRLIAETFGVPGARVVIADGAGSRDKRLVLKGVTADDAARRMDAIAAAPDNKNPAP